MTNAADLSPARRIGALVFLLTGYFFYAWSWNTVDILRPYIQADLGLSSPSTLLQTALTAVVSSFRQRKPSRVFTENLCIFHFQIIRQKGISDGAHR